MYDGVNRQKLFCVYHLFLQSGKITANKVSLRIPAFKNELAEMIESIFAVKKQLLTIQADFLVCLAEVDAYVRLKEILKHCFKIPFRSGYCTMSSVISNYDTNNGRSCLI